MIMIAGCMNTMPYSIVSDKNIVKFEQLKGTKTAVWNLRLMLAALFMPSFKPVRRSILATANLTGSAPASGSIYSRFGDSARQVFSVQRKLPES